MNTTGTIANISNIRRIKRLLKLADFVEKLPRKQFDLRVLAEQHECGTVCCLMGWTGMVPSFRRLGFKTQFEDGCTCAIRSGLERYSRGSYKEAAELFGLSHDESLDLFSDSNRADLYPSTNPTPKQAAKVLRNFVKCKLESMNTTIQGV